MKKISIVLGALMLLLVGCSSKPTEREEMIKELYEEEGWEFSAAKEKEKNKTIETKYQDFKVTSFEIASEYAGLVAEEGLEFYIVDVDVKNTSGTSNPYGNYDFAIYYEWEGNKYEVYSYKDLGNGEMYPDDVQLSDGETQSGSVLFEIHQDATLISFAYLEIHATSGGGSEMGTIYFVPLD